MTGPTVPFWSWMSWFASAAWRERWGLNSPWWSSHIPRWKSLLTVFSLWQRMREEMEEITQQQLVHDKYCKELMGFGTKPRHITPFTSFQSVQPQQSNALLGLLGYSTPQGFLTFGATPVPAKTSLVESRYCRELMEERFDQVDFTVEVWLYKDLNSWFGNWLIIILLNIVSFLSNLTADESLQAAFKRQKCQEFAGVLFDFLVCHFDSQGWKNSIII